MNHTAHSERLSEGVAFSGCNMRVLWQSNHIKSRARPASVTLNWEAVMAIRKRATRRTKAKRKKTLVTKTATPIKTKTVRKNKRAMNGSPLPAPQLITGARMLYLVWIPEDPSAVAALVPKELRPEARRSVFMNQYVVDSAEQTSSAGLPGAQLGTPGRWWTHYFNSSTNMIDYAKKRGVPAGAGETVLDFSGDQLIANTILGGAPVIRATCTVKVGAGQRASGQLRYVTRVSGQLVSGRYPFVMQTADEFHVDKLEFLDRSHPTYGLRPKSPLEVTFGFYSPDITFCYPGGEGPLNTRPHGV
jgi:hypothetical protein